jgi:hypothetical protein
MGKPSENNASSMANLITGQIREGVDDWKMPWHEKIIAI